METQILAFSETLKVTEGKTKAESVASLIWFLPYSPDLLLSTRFPGAKVSFLSRALGVTCTRRYVHSALRVGSWVCLQRTGKRVPLRRQVTRSEGGTSVWSWEKKGHWDSNTGIWCFLAFLSIHVCFFHLQVITDVQQIHGELNLMAYILSILVIFHCIKIVLMECH